MSRTPKAVLVSSTLLAGLCVVAVRAQGPTPIETGKTVERELAGGQTHVFTLRLNADQVARVTTEQKGVDVVVTVVAPDGTKLFDVDSPNGAQGDEVATVEASQGGVYRLEIHALEAAARPGRYAIRLDRFLTRTEYTTERLAGLGRLWGAAKFFHPSLAHKPIDWDAALIKAIPKVKAARTPDAYRAAIEGMLQTLEDPLTTTERAPTGAMNPPPPSTPAPAPAYFHVVDEAVVVHVADWARTLVGGGGAATAAKQTEMMAAIGNARTIVIDARAEGDAPPPPFYVGAYLDNALAMFLQGPVPLGTDRYRLHNGYAPQQGNTSGGYWSGLITRTPGAIMGQAKTKKPLAIVVDGRTPNLLPVLSGLQASGARVVHVGNDRGGAGAQLHRMLLPDGVRVSLRVTEFVHPGGGTTFQPDVRLTDEAGAGDRAVTAAIASLKTGSGAASTPADATTLMVGQKDSPYREMSFPAEEYRLLALFRFWNVINYFYPYKHLTDKPWATVLTDFIPRFLENRTALDYEMTVAEMAARMNDSHGAVQGLRNLGEHLGTFAPPVRLSSSAGGKLTVRELTDAPAANGAGISLGDVILSIDGEAVAQRVAGLARFRALSTTQSAYAYIYPQALRGAKDSKVSLRVEGLDGRARDVELTRSVALGTVSGMLPRKTPIYQVLPNGYGYIDLARLPLADAHKAMDAVMATPGLIFDMRGYPNGTAWQIAPRLSEKTNITAALFRRPLQTGEEFNDEDSGRVPDYSFAQQIPPRTGAVYKGKVAMLINEFAISQSEHTCMFFEAATDVAFVGSPTNGANGDVTNLILPGGIYVSFTGHDVRHADGRQLQRVGIQPRVTVEPTPKGISEGRDEVLEAAVKVLDGALKK